MDRRGRGGSGDGPVYAIEREYEDVVEGLIPQGTAGGHGDAASWGMRRSPTRLVGRGLEGPDLRLAFELRPVDPVEFHEPRGESHRFLMCPALAQGVAAHDLFRLAERAVPHFDLPPGEPDPRGFRQRFIERDAPKSTCAVRIEATRTTRES
jgi:hypothetical protein